MQRQPSRLPREDAARCRGSAVRRPGGCMGRAYGAIDAHRSLQRGEGGLEPLGGGWGLPESIGCQSPSPQPPSNYASCISLPLLLARFWARPPQTPLVASQTRKTSPSVRLSSDPIEGGGATWRAGDKPAMLTLAVFVLDACSFLKCDLLIWPLLGRPSPDGTTGAEADCEHFCP